MVPLSLHDAITGPRATRMTVTRPAIRMA
jgi:hypothetical protein